MGVAAKSGCATDATGIPAIRITASGRFKSFDVGFRRACAHDAGGRMRQWM
jgi:hypothetical protein